MNPMNRKQSPKANTDNRLVITKNTAKTTGPKVKTGIRAGGLMGTNHNETLVR